MTSIQKINLIKHIASLIFSVPVSDPRTLLQVMKNTLTGIEWSPWIIGNRIGGRTFKNSTTGQATLRGFDISLNLGELNPNGTIKLTSLRFIEQNPDKLDNYGNFKESAMLARQGHKIVWVISQGIEGGFLGKLQDGEWIQNRPQAYTRTNTTNVPTGIDQYGRTTMLNQGEWQPIPDISGQNIEDAVTRIVIDEGTENECVWEGI